MHITLRRFKPKRSLEDLKIGWSGTLNHLNVYGPVTDDRRNLMEDSGCVGTVPTYCVRTVDTGKSGVCHHRRVRWVLCLISRDPYISESQ